jgi:ADP-ribosylglycohydrolase
VLIAQLTVSHHLKAAASFEFALVDTVGRGGDTDTNAAMSRALTGAATGRIAILIRWR